MAVFTAAQLESLVEGIFRKNAWKVRRHPSSQDTCADFVIERGKKKYVVEMKSAAEGRRDRLIPLLSQAILEAQGLARQSDNASPLAIVGAKRVPVSVADHIRQFAERYAPGVAVGVIDLEGLRFFVGPELEGLNARPSKKAVLSSSPRPDLFSDLNQWMLKILLGQNLPQELIAVPRGLIRNASQLAIVANVSVMSASRFVHQLADEGFLDDSGENLRIARADELLERWVAANRKMARDVSAHWILKKDQKQFFADVAEYAAKSNRQRLCVGLFSAADALGLGFVHGISPHIYLESLNPDVLQKLGLSVLKDSGYRADVLIRIPAYREAVFRAAVIRDGLPVSDVLQIWLDASIHPARGIEQASEIRRRVLKPLFEKHR